MWPGAGTAVGVVTELVDVHAALGGGVMACDVPGDGCGRGLGRLLEVDGPADLGVTAEDCDCVVEREGCVSWDSYILRGRRGEVETDGRRV